VILAVFISTGQLLYNPFLEPHLEPSVTVLEVHGEWLPEGTLRMPAALSSFNMLSEEQNVTAPLVEMRLRPECQSNSYPSCIECWSHHGGGGEEGEGGGGPVLNGTDLQGAVAFLDIDPMVMLGGRLCFQNYYHYTSLAQEHGAVGLVLGGSVDVLHNVPGPYVVGMDVRIPTYNLERISTEVLLGAFAQNATSTSVSLPGLGPGGALPRYYADRKSMLGNVDISFTAANSTSGETISSFQCRAGQNTHNPEVYPSFTGAVVEGFPSEACGNRTSCAACLSQPLREHITAPGDGSLGPGSVLILHESDFPCYHSRSQFVEAAAAAAPAAPANFGLVLVELGWKGHHMDSREASVFPSFTVGQDCWQRMQVELVQQEGGSQELGNTFRVLLPSLAGGAAQEDGAIMQTGEDQEPSLLRVEGPAWFEEQNGAKHVMAGGAAFNPAKYDSVSAEAVLVDSKPECNSAATCALCDALESPFYTTPAEVAGKIALVGIELRGVRELPTGRSEHTVAFSDRCLYPWSNLVEQLEAMGARAVVFVNPEGEGVLTLMERGWSAEVGIPAFNVRLESGTVLASVMKYGSADPYLHGTSLDKGLMLTLPNSEGLLPEEAEAGGGAAGTTNPTDIGGAVDEGGDRIANGTDTPMAGEGDTPFERDVTIFSTKLGSLSEDQGEAQGRSDSTKHRLYIGLAAGIALCLAVGTWAYYHLAQSRRLSRFTEIEAEGSGSGTWIEFSQRPRADSEGGTVATAPGAGDTANPTREVDPVEPFEEPVD